MNCFVWTRAVNFNLKTKIRYDGREYSGPGQLPPEVRAAYEKSIADSATAAFWKARLFTDASASREAAQQRGITIFTQWYRDKNGAAALAAFEQAWPDAKGMKSQLPGWALQVAARGGDDSAASPASTWRQCW